MLNYAKQFEVQIDASNYANQFEIQLGFLLLVDYIM